MRHLVLTVLGLAACAVEAKRAVALDAGLDATPSSDAPDDDSAPDTMITLAPDEFSREGSASFQFMSDDATAVFQCSIDGETPVACTSPYTRTLGTGTHTFSVRAIDAAGNGDDTPAEHLWSIDMLAPDTMILEAPPLQDNSLMVQFTFGSAEENVTFDCSLDNSTYVACASGASVGPIGDGPHAFAVRARDRAGNVDASPAVHAWTVDTSTPDTQILSGPPAASSTTTASFAFVSPDAGSGATYQCSFDSAAFTTCTSPKQLSGLPEREHTFAVRVRDAVGNLDPSPATRTWTVDLTSPNTTIVTGPTGVEAQASATFTFSASEPDIAYACSLDGATFTACTSPANLTTLAQGAHTFAVRATDAAGLTDATPATRTWTVDTVAPDVTITSGPANAGTSGPRVTFAFTLSDGVAACSLDSSAYTTCASPMAFNLSAGAHQFKIRAIDSAGNIMITTRAWTVGCAAPDAIGAAALLHLDDPDQTLANAVSGGIAATLGDTTLVEVFDPASRAAGRFGPALAFTAADADRVAWPLALGALADLTLELWARPDATAGTRDLLVSADDRVALRAIAASPTTVRFEVTILGSGTTPPFIITSAVVAAGAWHHVVVVLDEPTLRLYVNGVRSDLANVAIGLPPALDAIRLGGTASAAYSGDLDEIWLAQTAIATDEAVLARYCPL